MTTATITSYILTRIKDNGLDLLGSSALAVGIFITFLVVIKIVVAKVKKRIQENSLQEDMYSKRMADLAGSMLFILLMIFNILAVFEIIWFDTALIMWGISISIGFAMETTIGNMIAGIMLMTNEKVKLWDFVQFMGSLNMMGTIEEINVRYTVIRTFDKRRTIIPNSVIAATPIKTLKTETLIRGDIKLRLPRHIDIDQIKSLLIQTLNNIDGVLHKEYTNIVVAWFDSGGISMQWFFFLNPKTKRNKIVIQREFMVNVFKEFKKYGIKIPHDHITLTVEN